LRALADGSVDTRERSRVFAGRRGDLALELDLKLFERDRHVLAFRQRLLQKLPNHSQIVHRLRREHEAHGAIDTPALLGVGGRPQVVGPDVRIRNGLAGQPLDFGATA
jgi:hypothetical protein